MTKEISISELTTGMYVLSVAKNDKHVKVKNPGYISSLDAINKLKVSGVISVHIDPSKTKSTAAPTNKAPQAEQQKEKTAKVVPLDKEIIQAEALYAEAKTLQSKLLDNIREGKTLDISSIKGTTEALVNSIFRNQDALCLMARLRDKDAYLVEHSLNVSILMSIFAKHLKLDKQIINDLALGAFLHDLGKIRIPDNILHKKGRFTDAEYQEMKKHVQYGVEAIQESPELPALALEVVQQHHERLDGKGYPNQSIAEQISQYGRMIAIVDSYDAMTAERVYKAGMHPIRAFRILTQDAPHAYDKALVEKFIQCLGVYPIGTLVKLTSGKIGLISQLNANNPLKPFVRVFYNVRLNQTIAIEELDLSRNRIDDQIDCCIKPEEFNLNLITFFKAAFLNG